MLNKNLILIIIILLIVDISSIQNEEDYEKAAEDYKNNYIKEFNEKVIKYLTERHLYKNESALV